MPVLMRLFRLIEAGSFAGRLVRRTADAARVFQDAVHRRGTCGHEVGVEHHEGQAAVTFLVMLAFEIEDRLFLPLFQPVVAGNPAVMFVDLAVARFPIGELALRNAQPMDQLRRGNLRPLVPIADVIHDFVTRIVGNPASV